MVLGQHFFNRTTDVTQTFGIEKYIPYTLYSVFSPSDHDLGELQGIAAALRAGGPCAPQARPGQGQELGRHVVRGSWGRAGKTGHLSLLDLPGCPMGPTSCPPSITRPDSLLFSPHTTG